MNHSSNLSAARTQYRDNHRSAREASYTEGIYTPSHHKARGDRFPASSISSHGEYQSWTTFSPFKIAIKAFAHNRLDPGSVFELEHGAGK